MSFSIIRGNFKISRLFLLLSSLRKVAANRRSKSGPRNVVEEQEGESGRFRVKCERNRSFICFLVVPWVLMNCQSNALEVETLWSPRTFKLKSLPPFLTIQNCCMITIYWDTFRMSCDVSFPFSTCMCVGTVKETKFQCRPFSIRFLNHIDFTPLPSNLKLLCSMVFSLPRNTVSLYEPLGET